MARRNTGLPLSVRGFSDYFETAATVQAIATLLGYSYNSSPFILPQYVGPLTFLPQLQARLARVATAFSLDSEISRREFLIAPLFMEIALAFEMQVQSELTLEVSDLLRGSIDYLLESTREIVVIEAKSGDLVRGFKQLTAELCAVDQWTDKESSLLYGAVTIGNAWQFAVLDRRTKVITQDTSVFGYPHHVETIVRALIAMLDTSPLT